MTTRMTKQLRDQILDNVIAASKYPKELGEIKKAIQEVVYDCYLAHQPEGFLDKVAGLPKEWFESYNSFYLSTYDRTYERDTAGVITKTYEVRWGDYGMHGEEISFPEVLLPCNYGRPGTIAKAILDTGIPARNAKRLKGLEKLREQTMGLLTAFNTVDKLLKEAPEMKKFIPKTSAAYPVPVVPVSNALTCMMDAGVEFEEATA